jgi:glycosyltransferase involved in cell wall biosynthesis
LIRNRDFIVLGLQPWDISIGSNCKNIALEFSKHNRVLYVNPPVDIYSYFRHKSTPYIQKRIGYRKNKTELQEVGPNIYNLYPPGLIKSINWIPQTRIFRRLNYINNKTFASDIKNAIRKLNISEPILFIDSDMFRSFHMPELLKPKLSVYYTRDNLTSTPYWGKHGKVMEPALMSKVDMVVANSEYLSELAARHNIRAFNVGQGCDLALFDHSIEREIPEDLAGIAKPVIGYIGAITSQRLDLELITSLCRNAPQWNFVFVGPADQAFSASELRTLPNVRFLGAKKEIELPSYLAAFDVAINPQKINEMTVGNYPRKIDEYLALGKPVVATRTRTMEYFKDVCYLGSNYNDYIDLIQKAIAEDGPELQKQRIVFSNAHTWENSVRKIYDHIEELENSGTDTNHTV